MNSPGANAPGMFQPPSRGRVVLVSDHNLVDVPAIITAVWSNTGVNATGFLPDGTITSFFTIMHKDHPGAGSITWRWPDYVSPVTLESLGFT
jgi:hypothetical protein